MPQPDVHSANIEYERWRDEATRSDGSPVPTRSGSQREAFVSGYRRAAAAAATPPPPPERAAVAAAAAADLPTGTSIELFEAPEDTLRRSDVASPGNPNRGPWTQEEVERAAIASLNAMGLVTSRPGDTIARWDAESYAAVCRANPGFHVKASTAGRFLLDAAWKAMQHGRALDPASRPSRAVLVAKVLA